MNALLLRNDEEDVEIEEMITAINRWNEDALTSLTIERYHWVDNKMYYGWRTTVSSDDISAKSMNSLNPKQITFFKLFLDVAIENSGLLSLNVAYTLNRGVLLGIKNILTNSELLQLFTILEKRKFISIINEDKFDNLDEKESELNDNSINDKDNKYYILGPQSFIDLKVWIESKTEHGSHECILCSDYVMYKGFKCKHDNCPNVVHQQCIKQYFQHAVNNNYKCPGCQNPVDINNIDEVVNEYIQILNHPNDAIKIIQNLKQRLSDNDNHND
eukprot:212935_1